MLRRNFCERFCFWFGVLGALVLSGLEARTAEAQLLRGRFLQRCVPASPCPCPDSMVVDQQSITPHCQSYTHYLTTGTCGTCGYSYDMGSQVWRYDEKNCSGGCECVLPAVARVGGKITTSCTKTVLAETEFRLQLEVAAREFHTFRFRLPNKDADSFSYQLAAKGKTWNVNVAYKQPGIACAPTPLGFPHELSSTLTTSTNTYNHIHNEKNSNCVVHTFGDFQVMITLAE
ncbi:MAG: hypothetical protein JNK57_11900 [Planctomycetaceae bacterium]|jgi:hypothetical protein|nr:hypothetical protein [Planctomycetaceae bacterium]